MMAILTILAIMAWLNMALNMVITGVTIFLIEGVLGSKNLIKRKLTGAATKKRGTPLSLLQKFGNEMMLKIYVELQSFLCITYL